MSRRRVPNNTLHFYHPSSSSKTTILYVVPSLDITTELRPEVVARLHPVFHPISSLPVAKLQPLDFSTLSTPAVRPSNRLEHPGRTLSVATVHQGIGLGTLPAMVRRHH